MARVPACLLSYAQAPVWVAWNLVRATPRALKVPYAPCTGAPASVSNPATWGTLEAATRLAKLRAYRGIGIVSAGVPDLVFLDLDRCVDAAAEVENADATRLLESCGETYAERTPSGAGLRIIGAAPGITASVSRNGGTPGGLALEIYKAAPRYLTVTGERWRGHPDTLANIGDEVLDLLPLLGGVKAAEGGADGREDGALIRRIVTGDGFHAELCALAARYLGRGMSREAAMETLRGFMQACPAAAQDDRWRDRFASIPKLIASAASKFADAAEHRRALARIACRLLRDGRQSGEVVAMLRIEADARGIDASRVPGIVQWAAHRELERRGVANG